MVWQHLRPCRLAAAILSTSCAVLLCRSGLGDEHPVVATDSKRPNILVILTDDQGWGDLSLHGNRNLKTPAIDSLARDGVQFDRFFVCPVCSPTRAEFLTGRYHPRSGVRSTSAGGERMDLDETTIADTFRAAGYRTAAFGKWHNGMQHPYHPMARGFEEFYGFCSGHWGNYFDPILERDGERVRGRGFIIDDVTDEAVRFIQADDNRPFFAYVAYNTPHSPMQVPERWWRPFAEKPLTMHHRNPEKENPTHLRAALAMCENIDWNVGRILEHLDQHQLADNTIVVFFCDNGPNGFRWNGGMKGRKGSTDEGGVRSPLLMRWPAAIPKGKRVRSIAAAIDLLPTLAGLANVPTVSKLPLDGKNLQHTITAAGEPDSTLGDRRIFSHWRGRVSVRTPRFRLDHNGRLFDMIADPGQRSDVASRHPNVTQQLKRAVAAWKADVIPKSSPFRPFTIGDKTHRITELPARDGRESGTIKRSNRFPNCSYFTNWTAESDAISWPVSVRVEGDYDVDVYYACPQADTGATIELSCGRHSTRAVLNVAHDPPVRGEEHDRVMRQESYVKDFKKWRLGTLRLAKGDGELVLRAPTIPASQAMEFRTLILTRR